MGELEKEVEEALLTDGRGLTLGQGERRRREAEAQWHEINVKTT